MESSPAWSCRPRRGRRSKAESFRPAPRSAPAHRPHGTGRRRRKRPPAQRPAAAANLQQYRSRQPLLLLAVADAIDRAARLIGNEHRAVLHLEDVRWTAVELVLLGVEQPLQEWRNRGLAARDLCHHHVIAVLLLAVPGAVPCDERDVLVLLREHVAVVELDAEPGRMRPR